MDANELLNAEQLQHFSAWPSVSEASVIDLPELSDRLESISDLRMAAAKKQADVLLSYTVDTVFQIKGRSYIPNSKIALDLVPDSEASIATKASAVFIDVRSGFIYGKVDATAQAAGLAAAWTLPETIDQKRLSTESQAVAQLLLKAEASWTDIAGRYQ